jgi:outer membrane biosynthesis protein TonB
MRNVKMMLLLVACCLVVSSTVAQKDAPALPTVTAFECPQYPSLAASNRLQGMVKLQVTTDGHQVVDVKLISGHPILAPTAYRNVQTWKFADHTPVTLAVTYYFVNEGKFKPDKITKCAAKMELPTKVTVSTRF